MSFDILHAILGLIAIGLPAYLKWRGIPVLGPTVPDLLPNNPILNGILKTILGKLRDSVPLLPGEEALAQKNSFLLEQHAPGLTDMISAIKSHADAKKAAAAAVK